MCDAAVVFGRKKREKKKNRGRSGGAGRCFPGGFQRIVRGKKRGGGARWCGHPERKRDEKVGGGRLVGRKMRKLNRVLGGEVLGRVMGYEADNRGILWVGLD
ncbi:hypothetical protein HAX54_034913 [Datura stramonium]|uniref:Uncharacterized protein n=1 Tax=Datura stramonium TaxID=4076 RepID=A0ABS8VFR1_DATST|nr:hypothetical protein [Datura stramonium]